MMVWVLLAYHWRLHMITADITPILRHVLRRINQLFQILNKED